MQSTPDQIPNTASVILDAFGKVLDHCESFPSLIPSSKRTRIGSFLHELLDQANSGWGDHFQRNRRSGISRFPFPQPAEGLFSTWDVQLQLLEREGLVFCTFEVRRNPKSILNDSVGEIINDPQKISQLFLRLQKSEARLESYMKHFPGVFFHQRADYSFQYISPNSQRLLDYPPDRLLRSGSQFLGLICDQDRDFFVQELRKHSARAEPFTLQYRIRKPRDGSVLHLTDVRSPVFSPSGMLLGYEGVWLDTTRQVIAERKLTSAAWKESLAILTAGLVHDFSNVMAGIYALSELYHANMEPGDRMYEGLGQIKKSSMEARKLVRRIIDINREEAGQKNYHDPRKLISEQVDLLKIIFPRGTRIDLELNAEEVPLYIDDVEFRQVMLNLAMNAKDAIENQGQIHIRTRKVFQHEILFENCHAGKRQAPRDGILITFEDNGSGIPSSYRDRLFHSFFTTKEIHKGSGFGLYNIQRIVRNAEGLIAFETADGKGTTFHLYFPEADFTEQIAENEARKTQTPDPHRQRPFVVVVGQEEASRFDLIGMLRAKQWEVIFFSQLEKLQSYLSECPRSPTLCLVIALHDERNTLQVCQLFRKLHPDTLFALLPMGLETEDVNPTVAAEMALICDSSLNPNHLLEHLEQLIRSPVKMT
jgi:PAS domain S-box-containing protein